MQTDPEPLRTALLAYVEVLRRTGRRSIRLAPGWQQGLRPDSPFLPEAASQMPPVAPPPSALASLPSRQPIASPSPTPPTQAEGAADGEERAARLRELREKTSGCRRCPHLASFRSQVVFGIGNPHARLLFAGEAPGAEEDRLGEPFVGPAGKLLTRMIQAMGLEREDVYIANVLKCRPDLPPGTPGNRKPTPEEMGTCLPYLREQITIIEPEAIVALGATALEGLTGLRKGISTLRGSFLNFQGIPLLPTFHPSYLLHNPSLKLKRQVWEDLLLVMERLHLPISARQRGFFLAKSQP
ncbi:uracil-DNA glycosylase family protein [Methylacidimicrobium sp. B4]|uniref:uracil-DNA glycosylase n=1 Tax=Methylacidimicrobium sp. B4 TaxID=2796139 RepID=UPI001A8EBB4A|nr:uracil-DNA glycosylase [Methylacidimicrobium sp. B4]QSR84852.1 uracil-DNA glycosylase [Methylacidimicrobium sp. B4]